MNQGQYSASVALPFGGQASASSPNQGLQKQAVLVPNGKQLVSVSIEGQKSSMASPNQGLQKQAVLVPFSVPIGGQESSMASAVNQRLGQKQVVPNQNVYVKAVPVKSRKTVSPLTLSIFFGVLFLVFASPLVFKFVNKLTMSIELNILEQSGVPNNIGLLLHTVVFIFVSALLLQVIRRLM